MPPNIGPLVKAGAKGVDYLIDALRTVSPQTVYHGSASKVATPNLSMAGKVSGIPEEGAAFWVTPEKASALKFGEMASKTPVVNQYSFAPKNPMQVDYPVSSILNGQFEKLKIDSLNQARKLGHDSVVFKQAGNGMKLVDDEIAVLNPSVLKFFDQ